MNLSKETLSKLKNFAEINNNLLVTKGNRIKTVNASKSLLGETVITESFDVDEFGFYDLNEFLGILSLFEEPSLEFSDKSVTVSDGKSSVKYFSASKEILVYPNRDIIFPEPDIEFQLNADLVNTIRKVSSVLNASNISIIGDGDEIKVNIGDVKNATAPAYSSVVGTTDKVFTAILKVDHFKLMPGAYTVSLSKKKISKFTNGDNVYYLAVEADSKFEF